MRHIGIAAIAVLVLLIGLGVSLVETSASQRWGQTLLDNFMLARSLPFTLGLGVALVYARAHWPGRVERRPRAVRRFDASTIWLHWIATLAVLLGLATGAWQYLKVCSTSQRRSRCRWCTASTTSRPRCSCS